ncbi:MAG: nitroreductase [Hyphomicrobiaceae bacterium]
MSSPVLDLLLTRRSVSANQMRGPGPTADELERILTAAVRVPDHKKLAPWRLIVFEGEGRERFGEVLAQVCAREETDPPSEMRLELESKRFMRAPVVVGVISKVTANPVAPEWEQILSAGALCQNLTLAANALGYATNWITEWCAYSPGVQAALGLARNERVAGFIYIGTGDRPPDRDRPKLANLITRW